MKSRFFYFIFGLTMMKNFLTPLRVRSVEQVQITLMLATGFFMGVFIATYQVTADSLFLNKLGDQLDKAFLIAGALGIITTSLFSYFQNLIKFSTLVVLSVLLVFGFTIGVYSLLHNGNPEYEEFLIFTLYCMTGPIVAVLLLSYWGTFGRLFNFRQSKRIIGWIDTGQLIAAIIATFSIPFTAGLFPDTTNYLLICAASILVVSVLLIVISSNFELSKNNPREFGKEVRKQTTIRKLFSDPYILLLSGFLLVSMITFVFSQFAFQELVKEQYPTQRELTNFMAFFTGSVYGLSLIMQTFVNNRIISNYGLKISLYLLPIIVGIFSIIAVTSGGFFGFEKATNPVGFLYFFLFISLSRLFNWTIRDSLENPVFKLFFIPLEGDLRFSIQSKVEGLVNESARFIAGLMIFLFALIPSFRVIHLSILIVIFAGLYLFFINKLYGGYRSKIRLKLESGDSKVEKLERGFSQVSNRLQEMLRSSSSEKAVFSFKLLEKLNATNVSSWINSLMKNDDETTRYFGQQRMNEMKGLSVSDKYVIRVDEASDGIEPKNVLSRLDLEMIIENDGDISKQRIQKLTRSSNPDDRHYAAELLLHTSKEECTSFLMELLVDAEPKVRKTAIKTAVKKHNPEVIIALVENLGSPEYSNQSMNSLVLIGEESLTQLDAAFHRTGQTSQVMLKIVQVMGRIGGARAKEMLWTKMDYPNKVVVSQVLLALGECGFKAGISQITRIKYVLEADLADIRWNLSAIQEIESEAFGQKIKESLRLEVQGDIEHIYTLLAMLYDTRSIQLVKENIESNTSEGITYAVEMLDVFLSDQLKQRVIPVLDDLTDSERINKLEDFYPRASIDSKLVLKFIINRDFTQSNRWTKACVLFHLGLKKYAEFELDLIAQIFNPDSLISEVAAYALFQISADAYHTNVPRLGEKRSRELNDLILHSKKMTRFEKVLFLQRINAFEAIPGIILSHLADICEEVRLNAGETLVLDEKNNNNFYVMVAGSVEFFKKGELVSEFTDGQFVGEMLGAPNFVNTNLVKAKKNVVMLRFNKDQFYELLIDNVELADKIIEFI